MRCSCLSGLVVVLTVAAGSARADDVQWHPVPATPTAAAPSAAPAVTLRAPVANAAPVIQPASYTDAQPPGAQFRTSKPSDMPQPLPTGPNLKVERFPTNTPVVTDIPGPAQETWGNPVSSWNGVSVHGGPPNGGPIPGGPIPGGPIPGGPIPGGPIPGPPNGMVPYGDGGCGGGGCGPDGCGAACDGGACCDDGGWCGWLRRCCCGWLRRGGDCCDTCCFDDCCAPRSRFWAR